METTWKLPEEFKAKWIAALRSGEYKQGQSALCSLSPAGEKEYCCLGVGYRIAKGVDPGKTSGGYITNELLIHGVPPQIVGSGAENKLALHLARLNDNGKSFSEIADYIEANL